MFKLVIFVLCFGFMIAESSAKIVDLSYEFQENTTVYIFNFKPFSLTNLFRGYRDTASGTKVWVENEEYSAHSHGGTHMDAPSHMAISQEARAGRWSLEGIPPERMMGPLRVINVESKAAQTPNYGVTVSDITRHEDKYGRIPRDAVVIINSGWGKRYPNREEFLGPEGNYHYPGWTKEAAQYLINNRDIHGAGADGPSLDTSDTKDLGAHTTFLGGDVFGLEMVANLHLVPEAGALAIALPMKNKGASGGPCRVLAIWGSEKYINHASGLTRSSSSVIVVLTMVMTIITGRIIVL